MLRHFICSIGNSKIQLQKDFIKRVFSVQKPIEGNATNAKNDLLERYTKEESEKILRNVNSLELDDMLSYSITKGRASKLLAWRQKNGALQSIEDIYNVEGLGGVKVINKFCQSLLQQPPDKGSKKLGRGSRLGSFLTPALDTERREIMRSCVSVRIGVSSVTWARLELPALEETAPCQLTHWQHHEISEKKLHLNDLVQRCLYVDHMIPTADCYVFESPQTAQVATNPGNAEQQNVSIQKAQITAILSYALASRNYTAANVSANDTGTKPKVNSQVYYLRRFLTARLFKHFVGTERVSSEETILQMMRTYYNIPDQEQDRVLEDTQLPAAGVQHSSNDSTDSSSLKSLRTNVQFDMAQREMFARAQRYHREFLGQALLLNLAFIRLALLQDSKSIAAVTRLSNKDREVNFE